MKKVKKTYAAKYPTNANETPNSNWMHIPLATFESPTPHLFKNILSSVGYPSACAFSQCMGQNAWPLLGESGQTLG